MATTLQRGYVSRITHQGVFITLPRDSPGFEFGPMEAGELYLAIGDQVLVGSVDNLSNELVVICKLQNPRNIIGRAIESETAQPITPILA